MLITCLNPFSNKFICTDLRSAHGCYIKKEMHFQLFVMLIAGIFTALTAAQFLAPYTEPLSGLTPFGLSPQALELAKGTAANFLGMASGIVGKHFWEKQWGSSQTAENLPKSQQIPWSSDWNTYKNSVPITNLFQCMEMI